MHIPPIPAVEDADPEIARLVQDEARRQYEKARLIPSENYVSVAVLEASGGLTLERAREVGGTGVDFISVGALTHSVKVFDLGLDLVEQ